MTEKKKFSWAGSPLVGAAFLMATSAIGPGFLTQTANFTGTLLASFGFVILVSILLDIGAQLNIWRILGASGLKAQQVTNKLIPGAGPLLSFLIVTGGLVFNIGNLAGAGLGLQVLTGWSPETGAIISAAIALLIFYQKEALRWMDGFSKFLGILMLGLTLYVVWASDPPLLEAGYRTILPEKIDVLAIITLVGGTVGGYISFAGAHRLLDAGLTGPTHTKEVSRSAVSAILLASAMRILLFLAALGVVMKGLTLDSANPAASVFQLAAGNLGYKLFGIVMWSAAITSVVGSAYTSISFLSSGSGNEISTSTKTSWLTIFVITSLAVFIWWGKPVSILIMAGAINGFILPLALGFILLAANKQDIVGEYKHPLLLKLLGFAVVVITLYMSVATIIKMGL